MLSAGFKSVEIQAVEGTRTASEGKGYLSETEDPYSYVRPYADLSDFDRNRVRARLVDLASEYTIAGKVVLTSKALISTGMRT